MLTVESGRLVQPTSRSPLSAEAVPIDKTRGRRGALASRGEKTHIWRLQKGRPRRLKR
jgi:hypothetical protein